MPWGLFAVRLAASWRELVPRKDIVGGGGSTGMSRLAEGFQLRSYCTYASLTYIILD